MDWFKKKDRNEPVKLINITQGSFPRCEAETFFNDPNAVITTLKESNEVICESIKEPKEEWIWVEGYKGTDKDIKCKGFQYTIDTQYDIPEEKVAECVSGFHLCLKLNDVFSFYNIGESNRFFKVKALVRKADVEKYGEVNQTYLGIYRKDKLVAKSIIFMSELTQDEILKDTKVELLNQTYKDLAIKCDIKEAINVYHKNTLIEDGYSEAFANYIINQGWFDKTHAIGSMKDVSMDMKVLFILQSK